MAKLILFTGAKGGAGKSTVCAVTGARIGAKGNRVLLLEATRRSIDDLLDVTDRVVYSWQDVIKGACTFEDALIPVDESGNTMLLCGPAKGEMQIFAQDAKQLMDQLSDQFDYIFVDIDGLYETSIQVLAPYITMAIIVTTADRAGARRNKVLSELLEDAGVQEIRLCINQLAEDFVRRRAIPDLDWLIDEVCAQLIAIIPFNAILTSAPNVRYLVGSSNQIGVFFENFAQRIMGNYIDLSVW